MELDSRQTFIAAALTLFLGKWLTKKITVLQTYNIPEPVSGGIMVSLFFAVLYAVGLEVSFDTSARDSQLIVFFITIGLSAKLSELAKGGMSLVILLGLAMCYLFTQNVVGLSVISMTSEHQAVGLICGSVSLSGGHGTAIAWAPKFVEQFQITNAMEIGIACATFGLVLGGVIGGPIAKYLIKRYNLQSSQPEKDLVVGVTRADEKQSIDYQTVIAALLIIAITAGLGEILANLVNRTGVNLPAFVTAMFAGILLTNTVPHVLKKVPWPAQSPSMSLIADLSLGLFLATSLMSLQLWTLIELAGPILMVLAAQLVVVVAFVVFVVFRCMGRNYDAAVMSAGYAGLALGATPTAIANMTAVTKSFGAAPRAFLVVPLVGAFFVDIANALILSYLSSWIS